MVSNRSRQIEVRGMSKGRNGKVAITIFGSVGLPQYTAKGYRLYLSDKEDDYQSTKGYTLLEIKPGERIVFEADDPYNGKGVVTVVRPTGYVVLQKTF
jgi:beta-galactosidase